MAMSSLSSLMITLDVSSGVDLEYLAEGAANIVYKIIPRPSTPSVAADSAFFDDQPGITELAPLQVDPTLEGKLVRLRKATAPTCSVLDLYEYYKKTVVSLFPQAEDRVEYVLFNPTSGLISDLNQHLKAMESKQSRPEKRHGTYLAQGEDYGLLVTDMSCSSPSSVHHRCFEFKPKWLVQSPSAPANAVRCRTCALRNFRRLISQNNSPAGDHSAFCPLGLVSIDRRVVERTVSNIFGWHSREEAKNSIELTLRQQLIDLIHGNALLDRLRDLQLTLDPHGVLSIPSTNHDFLTAMTLRDCTVFIKV